MDAFIYDAIRTPRGMAKDEGSLATVKPIKLVSQLLQALESRHSFNKELVEDIVLGCVTQVNGQGANIAKIAALYAKWPVSVSGITVNRFCASGLDAVAMAALKTHSGMENVVLAGGVESVSNVSMFADKGAWFADEEVRIRTGFVQMGVSADIIASLEGFTRSQLDEYAVQSQQRAANATKNHHFARAIIPIYDDEGNLLLDQDELIRENSTTEKLSKLQPSFIKYGVGEAEGEIYRTFPELSEITHLHHPGNSPALADGASLLLIGSKSAEHSLGIKPRAKIIGVATAAASPFLLTGGQAATMKVLEKTNLSVEEIDLFEYNEAFAATVLKYMRDLKIDQEKINVNGGAISMGHALGATGGMLVATLLDELERRGKKRGLIAVSGGGGTGTAMIIERIE